MRKRKGLRCLTACGACLMLFSGIVGETPQPAVAAADNPVLKGGTNRADRGSSYWPTSNLREWLNSDRPAGEVAYTQAKPSYADEAGFLNGFTDKERSGIAVTRHRAWISSYDSAAASGGVRGLSSSSDIGGYWLSFANSELIAERDHYFYRTENDKVYLLTQWNALQYVQKRGDSLIKELTPEAKAKNSYYGNTATWWMNAPMFGLPDLEGNYYFDPQPDRYGGYTPPKNRTVGVAPILNLKPETSVGSRKAGSLKIGEKLTYGHYLGAPVEWQVVNKTNGYPMLLSTHVLDLKEFDHEGDYSYQNSTAVQFPAADLSLTGDEFTPTDGSSDRDMPMITVTNEDQLFARQNGPYTLNIQVTDSGSGVDHVVLPDGSVTHSLTFSYRIDQNKTYLFKACDRAGNWRTLTLPVNNVNAPSSVLITPSRNGWTNQPVNVHITASNQIGVANWNGTSNRRDSDIYAFPNYTAYNGKRLRVRGMVSLVSASAPTSGITATLGLYYRALTRQGAEYDLFNRWPSWNAIPLDKMKQEGPQPFDFVVTIPNDYNYGLRAVVHMNINSNVYSYKVAVKNLSIELLDNDDFAIKSITLPDGRTISSNDYTDTLTENGTYVYRVKDSRGYITSKTVTVYIDKERPTLSIHSENTAPTKADGVTLHASAADGGGSGVTGILTPNGEWVAQSAVDYKAQTNGTYTFQTKDAAGNVTTQTYTVTNIDRKAPSLTVSGNPQTVVHDRVTLQAAASDASGIRRVQTPDGVWHSGSSAAYSIEQNGDYTFRAEDAAGNGTAKTVHVVNIGDFLYVTVPGASGGTPPSIAHQAGLLGRQHLFSMPGVSLHLEDNRDRPNGWSLSLTAAPFRSDSGRTLSNVDFLMKRPILSGTDQTPSVLLSSGYTPLSPDQPLPVLKANPGAGTGDYTLDLQAADMFQLRLPAKAYAGVYHSVLTWSLVSAP